MHKSTYRIFTSYIFLIIVLVGSSLNTAWGQDDSTPIDGEERSEADSTKKKTRVTQPLESYFFVDSVRGRENISWTIDKNYNNIEITNLDTTLNNWRIDYPFLKTGVGNMSLGGLGQASQAISHYDRANYDDHKFAQPFSPYIFTLDNTPFYNVKNPMTLFSYLESGQTRYRESNFGIMHAQNINPTTGFAVDYKARSTKGEYMRQDTKNHNLALTLYHTGKRYSAQGGYLNNNIKTEENGGVVGLWAIRDSIFEMPSGIPTKLGDAMANNKYSNNTFFVKQAYGIPLEPMLFEDFTMANKTAIYVGHTFEYNRWSKVYSDTKAKYYNDLAGIDSLGNYISQIGYYYDDWFINPTKSRDSIFEGRLSNRLYIQAQPWSRDALIATIDGGVGVDNYTFSQFDMSSYLSGKYKRDRETSYLVYGSASGRFKRYFDWQAKFELHPAGYRSGDMTFDARATMRAYLREKPLIVSGKFSHQLRSPNYWQENLFSNHYVFNTPLNKENITRAEASLSIPDFNLEIGATELMVDKMIYYDAQSRIAQAGGITSITSLYLRKKFQLGGLNLDHRVLAQWSSNQVVAPTPDLSAYISYYYEFWVEKLRVLRLQVGVDCRYTTRYYMPGYNPALSTFYNQREAAIGDYPYADIYLMAKWKRMRIFVKYQHINQYMIGNDEYFTVAGYPQNPGALKIGFSWGFYD